MSQEFWIMWKMESRLVVLGRGACQLERKTVLALRFMEPSLLT